jgi:hypothetical protein
MWQNAATHRRFFPLREVSLEGWTAQQHSPLVAIHLTATISLGGAQLIHYFSTQGMFDVVTFGAAFATSQ